MRLLPYKNKNGHWINQRPFLLFFKGDVRKSGIYEKNVTRPDFRTVYENKKLPFLFLQNQSAVNVKSKPYAPVSPKQPARMYTVSPALTVKSKLSASPGKA